MGFAGNFICATGRHILNQMKVNVGLITTIGKIEVINTHIEKKFLFTLQIMTYNTNGQC